MLLKYNLCMHMLSMQAWLTLKQKRIISPGLLYDVIMAKGFFILFLSLLFIYSWKVIEVFN